MDKAREAAATAAGEVMRDAFDNRARPVRDVSNAAIDAYIAARRAEGFVEVPVEPTEAVLSAGAHVIRDIGERRFLVGSVMADEIYRTMLKAAEERQSPPSS